MKSQPHDRTEAQANATSQTSVEDKRDRAAARQRAEQMFRSFVERSLDGITLTDENGTVTEWNSGMERITGLNAEQALGRPMWDVQCQLGCEEEQTPAWYQELEAMIRGVLQSGQAPWLGQLQEREIWRPDGSRCHVERVLFPIPTDEGFMLGSISREVTDRKHAQEALRQERDLLARIMETSPMAIVVLDRQGRITFANRSMEVVGGLAGSELTQRAFDDPAWRMFDAEGHALPTTRWPVARVLATGQALRDEQYIVEWGDGRTLPLSISAAPLFDEGGQVDGVVVTVEDVTERMQTQEDMAAANQLLGTILENTPVLVAFLDAEFNFLRVNRAYAQADERDPSFFPGKNHFDLYPNAENQRIFERVVETGEPYVAYAKPFEYAEHRERGVSYWDWSLVPTQGPQGEVTGLVLSLSNVTEQVEVRKALEESEAQFRQFAANVESAMWIGTPADGGRGRVLYMNPAFEHIFGIPAEEIIRSDHAWLDILHQEDRDRTLASLEAFVRDQEDYDVEYRIVRADGALRWIWARGFPIRNEKGEIYRTAGIAQDITERKHMEEALRKRTDELGERVKELNCLYEISKLVETPGISLEEILRGVVDLIPAAWRYPEITCAQIVLEDQRFRTPTFRETAWRQVQDLVVQGERVGRVEVCYLEDRPEADEGPFLQEERELLQAIAQRLGNTIERIQTRVTLRESEREYRRLVENLQEGVWAIDRDACTTYVNPRMAEMLGYTVEEMRGRHLFDFMDAQGVAAAKRHLERRQEGISEQHDFEFLRKDGTRLHAAMETSPITDEEGNYLGALAGMIDITERVQVEEALQQAHADLERRVAERTAELSAANVQLRREIAERRQAEEALRKSQELLDRTLSSLRDALFIIDADTTEIIDGNPAASDIFGYGREEMLGRTTALLHVDEAAREQFQTSLHRAMEEDGFLYLPEFRMRRKDGTLFPAEHSVTALQDEDGRHLAWVSVVRDLTERQRAEEAMRQYQVRLEALRELDRLRSELIANVSHEIRTPLGLIEVFATSLLMDDVEFDAETERQFLQGIKEETDRLDVIVGNLLSLSRIESGRLHVHRQPTDLVHLAREILEGMKAQATEEHCLELDVPSTPLLARVDVRQMEQLLRNLLSNAIKYSPGGGRVTVHARAEDEELVLCVSDQGIGIPPDEQEKIFDRFYRVESEVSRQVQGIGLGLAVCCGIVEAHGGRIRVESVPGEGSTFSVYLPWVKAAESDHNPSSL
jgi:PAS domain S-box-containing protein